MTYLKEQQFGDQVAVDQKDVSGTEGETKGNLLIGVNRDGETEICRIDQGSLAVNDRTMLSVMAEVLNELRIMNLHLAHMTGEDFTGAEK